MPYDDSQSYWTKQNKLSDTQMLCNCRLRTHFYSIILWFKWKYDGIKVFGLQIFSRKSIIYRRPHCRITTWTLDHICADVHRALNYKTNLHQNAFKLWNRISETFQNIIFGWNRLNLWPIGSSNRIFYRLLNSSNVECVECLIIYQSYVSHVDRCILNQNRFSAAQNHHSQLNFQMGKFECIIVIIVRNPLLIITHTNI